MEFNKERKRIPSAVSVVGRPTSRRCQEAAANTHAQTFSATHTNTRQRAPCVCACVCLAAILKLWQPFWSFCLFSLSGCHSPPSARTKEARRHYHPHTHTRKHTNTRSPDLPGTFQTHEHSVASAAVGDGRQPKKRCVNISVVDL